MAVVIASNLRKELAGNVLFDGVSFSVERRDRVALSGPNGAGKTTLLRILAGETEKHGGELAFQKGTRVALHDQRPPLEQATVAARVRPLRRARPRRDGGGARAARAGDGRRRARPGDAQSLRRGAGAARARRRLRLARPRGVRPPRARLRGRRSRPPAADVLRRRADARFARARARRRPRSAPPRRADEPPRRREPRVARARAQLDRRRRDPRRARPLVPRGGDDGDDGDRGRPLDVLPRPVAQVAAREGGADAARAEGGRTRPERHRAARALRRAVPRKKDKAKQAQAKLTQIGRLQEEKAGHTEQIALLSRKTRGLGFEFLKPARSGRTVVEANGVDVAIGDRVLLHDATFAIERGEHVALVGPNGSGKTTLLERLVKRARSVARLRRRGRLLLAAGDGARHARLRPPVRAVDDRACSGRTRRICSAASSSPAGTRTRSRWRCCPEASGGGSRSR